MLTFDTIRDLERKEKSGKTLEKLPDSLMEEFSAYLRAKEKSQNASEEILELENVRNTIKRFTDARTRKILDAAFDNARAGLEPKNLAPWEKEFFRQITDLINKHRSALTEELKKPAREKTEEKFLVKKTIPEFVGPDMKTYSLKKGDTITLKNPLNELLLKEGVVERA